MASLTGLQLLKGKNFLKAHYLNRPFNIVFAMKLYNRDLHETRFCNETLLQGFWMKSCYKDFATKPCQKNLHRNKDSSIHHCWRDFLLFSFRKPRCIRSSICLMYWCLFCFFLHVRYVCGYKRWIQGQQEEGVRLKSCTWNCSRRGEG